jgi:DNA invertase Pin-like site-specific DNA recombinase
LEKNNINFVSITEKVETNSAAGKLIFHLFGALSEFERQLIRERTKAGIAAARARGRKGGRRPSLDQGKIKEIKALMADPTIKVSVIAKRYGVSRATLYKHASKS